MEYCLLEHEGTVAYPLDPRTHFNCSGPVNLFEVLNSDLGNDELAVFVARNSVGLIEDLRTAGFVESRVYGVVDVTLFVCIGKTELVVSPYGVVHDSFTHGLIVT